jgi:hypothetical protein
VPLAVLVGETLPQSGEQAVPLCVKDQLTPLLDGSLPTVAVNCKVAFNGINAPPLNAGLRETVMAGTTTLAAPEAAALLTDVAVMVTTKSAAGGVAGAV